MFNRSKFLAGALLAAVFAAGGAVGAAVVSQREARVETPGRRDGERQGQRERGRERSYIGWLDSELTLVPAQRDTIARILDNYQGAMREISASVRPRLDSIRIQIRAEIMAVLDPTQLERYRTLMARSDSSRRAERERDSVRNAKMRGEREE